MYAKFRCAPLHIKKALGIFRELITTTRTTTTTRVAFGDPPSGSKKKTDEGGWENYAHIGTDGLSIKWVNRKIGILDIATALVSPTVGAESISSRYFHI